jgi:hypothetical protein
MDLPPASTHYLLFVLRSFDRNPNPKPRIRRKKGQRPEARHITARFFWGQVDRMFGTAGLTTRRRTRRRRPYTRRNRMLDVRRGNNDPSTLRRFRPNRRRDRVRGCPRESRIVDRMTRIAGRRREPLIGASWARPDSCHGRQWVARNQRRASPNARRYTGNRRQRITWDQGRSAPDTGRNSGKPLIRTSRRRPNCYGRPSRCNRVGRESRPLARSTTRIDRVRRVARPRPHSRRISGRVGPHSWRDRVRWRSRIPRGLAA